MSDAGTRTGDYRHTYAHQGAQDRERFEPPTRHTVAAWSAWAWERLGIFVHTEDLLAPMLGLAQPLGFNGVRGCITLSTSAEHPLWLLCHEIGHLMADHGYGLDLASDDRYWQRVPAEVAASEYALGLLIDEHELMDWLADGSDVAGAAQRWCVPQSAIEWRLRIAGVRAG